MESASVLAFKLSNMKQGINICYSFFSLNMKQGINICYSFFSLNMKQGINICYSCQCMWSTWSSFPTFSMTVNVQNQWQYRSSLYMGGEREREVKLCCSFNVNPYPTVESLLLLLLLLL